MSFAEQLRAARKAHGYTQEALAEKLGVSRQAVQKWERGAALPGSANLLALNELLGLTLPVTPAEPPRRSRHRKRMMPVLAVLAMLLLLAGLWLAAVGGVRTAVTWNLPPTALKNSPELDAWRQSCRAQGPGVYLLQTGTATADGWRGRVLVYRYGVTTLEDGALAPTMVPRRLKLSYAARQGAAERLDLIDLSAPGETKITACRLDGTPQPLTVTQADGAQTAALENWRSQEETAAAPLLGPAPALHWALILMLAVRLLPLAAVLLLLWRLFRKMHQ